MCGSAREAKALKRYVCPCFRRLPCARFTAGDDSGPPQELTKGVPGDLQWLRGDTCGPPGTSRGPPGTRWDPRGTPRSPQGVPRDPARIRGARQDPPGRRFLPCGSPVPQPPVWLPWILLPVYIERYIYIYINIYILVLLCSAPIILNRAPVEKHYHIVGPC